LIGEELFAASGYLSGDRRILASVRAQDIMKVVIILALILAVVWSSIGLIFKFESGNWWVF